MCKPGLTATLNTVRSPVTKVVIYLGDREELSEETSAGEPLQALSAGHITYLRGEGNTRVGLAWFETVLSRFGPPPLGHSIVLTS